MNNKKRYLFFFLAVLLFGASLGFVFRILEKYQKEITLTNEEELKVNLEAGFGNIQIEKGASNQILQANINASLKNDITEYIDYDTRDNIGYLNINTTDIVGKEKKKHSFHVSGFEDNNWNLRFTDAVPISFDIELGMGKGTLDFTGLQVKDLNLSAGASSVVMRFDKPNKSTIENLNIETGLSKFKGIGICNANFEHFKFQGGVGSYTLDFSGALERDVDVDIEVGLGSVTIAIPEDIGVKVYYEKNWVSSSDFPKDFHEQEENSYYSSNYRTADGRINMNIQAGLGSVKIKRL